MVVDRNKSLISTTEKQVRQILENLVPQTANGGDALLNNIQHAALSNVTTNIINASKNQTSLLQKTKRLSKKLPTTTVNIVLQLPGLFSTFNAKQLLILRSLAIASSSLSIILVFISMYFLWNMDKRRVVFRHQFIFYLLFCDFLKAATLLIYPIVILIRNEVYGQPALFNTIGFFTQFATEGADLAIFFFALHFALLVFQPKRKYLNKKTGNLEGGLYRYRYLVYFLTLIIPLVLASLAFIDYNKDNLAVIKADSQIVLNNLNYNFEPVSKTGGYKPLSTICSLPPWPIWYSLVLSWGPRYAIMASIIGIYIAIYIHVINESSKIKNQLVNFSSGSSARAKKDLTKHKIWNRVYEGNNYLMKILYLCKIPQIGMMLIRLFEFDIAEDDDENNSEHESRKYRKMFKLQSLKNRGLSTSANKKTSTVSLLDKAENPLSDNNAVDANANTLNMGSGTNVQPHKTQDSIDELKNAFNYDVYNQFKQKRLAIKKQVKSIFLYPISYLFCWIIPFVESFIQMQYEEEHGPVVGISYVSTFMHPFNGFVDSCVFLFREKPWKYYWYVVEREELIDFYSAPCSQPHPRRPTVQYSMLTQGTGTSKTLNDVDLSSKSSNSSDTVVNFSNGKSSVSGNSGGRLLENGVSDGDNNEKGDQSDANGKRFNNGSTSKLRESLAFGNEKGAPPAGMTEYVKWELLNSDYGRQGWYYKGSVKKKSCWRHSSSKTKRFFWFLYRFRLLFTNGKLNFQDNCNDSKFWNEYYQLSEEEQSLYDFQSYDLIPWYWRLYHTLPLKKGVDLDEVDLVLKQKRNKEAYDFNSMVLPGMNLVNFKKNRSTKDKSHNIDSLQLSPLDEQPDLKDDTRHSNHDFDNLDAAQQIFRRHYHIEKKGKQDWYRQQEELQKKHDEEQLFVGNFQKQQQEKEVGEKEKEQRDDKSSGSLWSTPYDVARAGGKESFEMEDQTSNNPHMGLHPAKTWSTNVNNGTNNTTESYNEDEDQSSSMDIMDFLKG
ncbi:hypothetical protein ACO0QE_001440 [Hanseniaspora vineae]